MTKKELIEFLEPYPDRIEIRIETVLIDQKGEEKRSIGHTSIEGARWVMVEDPVPEDDAAVILLKVYE